MTRLQLHSPQHRSAFTLVELMVSITVIGLLVGILLVAVAPAFKRAGEAAIQFEMKQIETCIEKFKTKYGFYPPSFVRIQNPGDLDGNGTPNQPADCALALLPYLNRIAPNHQELAGVGGGANPPSRLVTWYVEVGQHIGYDHGDDLVFWLSGICKNKQFPLTDGADGTSIATFQNTCPSAFDREGGPEREVFYDFKSGQLVVEPAGMVTQVAHYTQPRGKEAEFLYIDANSYGYGPSLPTPIAYDGYHVLEVAGPPVRYYENPERFQLVTFGMDGLPGNSPSGNPSQWAVRDSSSGTPQLSDPIDREAEDNLANFLDGGRMERLILGTIPSTANSY